MRMSSPEPIQRSQPPANEQIEQRRLLTCIDIIAEAPAASELSFSTSILYTDYIYYFQAAGMVLLVAMVGAIVLTLRHKQGVKRQNIIDQVARTPATAIEVVKVKPGQGI